MDVDLDETDIEILKRLEKSDDKNLEELSDELGLSKSAIHYRVTNLKQSDVITTISADVDPHALDLNMLLFTEVTVSHESGYAEDVGESLTEIDGVNHVYYMMGDVDFIVISRVQNHDQMHVLIDDIVEIEGVNETSSRFVIQELETGGQLIENMSEEMVDKVVE
ncbi:Lrp/AsnC family transcription regulator (plasmid) [Natrialba magadii ATCC 43099]|uniref:AsnC family transcriptional regulator n=1 Tax=Natrialba magadii (strain ATCC 43099 / DSM 3394 / CCM 3739 / CIP 104546 / IAM 13178 / JCM 8861 / NBRC 102185 / NCIMB 2190 / MS3) TaxID=547559 RepID=D3T135_NATMM|nr:Lrp/AsnC family transcriptional regulator [Natrialba magadii]ADD07294.1 Lrp/AsnC family transcription regulator [Natrialba magadii ATCC 43099]ELY32722.1 AsnC family transcriptional regulator [Natrialba magadii ATCC 43099]